MLSALLLRTSIKEHRTTKNIAEAHSNPLHLILSISADVHCINVAPIHCHKQWSEQNKLPTGQVGVRPLALRLPQWLHELRPLKLVGRSFVTQGE
jgi:hypothetical protein